MTRKPLKRHEGGAILDLAAIEQRHCPVGGNHLNAYVLVLFRETARETYNATYNVGNGFGEWLAGDLARLLTRIPGRCAPICTKSD